MNYYLVEYMACVRMESTVFAKDEDDAWREIVTDGNFDGNILEVFGAFEKNTLASIHQGTVEADDIWFLPDVKLLEEGVGDGE